MRRLPDEALAGWESCVAEIAIDARRGRGGGPIAARRGGFVSQSARALALNIRAHSRRLANIFGRGRGFELGLFRAIDRGGARRARLNVPLALICSFQSQLRGQSRRLAKRGNARKFSETAAAVTLVSIAPLVETIWPNRTFLDIPGHRAWRAPLRPVRNEGGGSSHLARRVARK